MSRVRRFSALASGAVCLATLFLVAPSPARAAQGVSLAWNHCLAQGTGVQNKQFACDVNTGAHVLVGAFTLSSAMPGVNGAEMVLQLGSAGPSLPAWWQLFFAGSCRQASLTANGNADPADVACPKWGGDQLFVGLATYCTSTGTCVDRPSATNQARIKIIEAVPTEFATPLVGSQEYFSFNLVIGNAKTVGTDACAGCETPVCIVFNSINVVAGPIVNRFISTPSSPGSNFVTWQGGAGTNCPAATPTRNSTWGGVKSLYR